MFREDGMVFGNKHNHRVDSWGSIKRYTSKHTEYSGMMDWGRYVLKLPFGQWDKENRHKLSYCPDETRTDGVKFWRTQQNPFRTAIAPLCRGSNFFSQNFYIQHSFFSGSDIDIRNSIIIEDWN